MAYQKLNGFRSITVVPSDTIDVPNPAQEKDNGANTSISANNLAVTGAGFLAKKIKIGDIVYNTTTPAVAKVTSVADESLGLSADIFLATPEDYRIFAGESIEPFVFHVDVAGTVTYETSGGDSGTITSLAGQYHPIQCKKIKATGTAATGIVALR